MRLFPADPEVNLYEEGFGTSDFLDRRKTAVKLSNLVEGIDDPIVIALDGAWGTGKTHFLKRWVGAHKLENGGVAQTIYFDAFQSDYLEDPLVAITAAIGARIEGAGSATGWKKLKTAAFKLAKPVTRIGLAVATYGATELTGALADVALEAGGKELEEATDAFWKKEEGRRAAMDQLRAALAALTDRSKDKNPLVIVIDELDRCRPDYALGILEVIKHFFTVPRVHFILGVNLQALQNSVRARYGSGIAAEEYLRRFVTLSIRLPEHVGRDGKETVVEEYFNRTAKDMDINREAASVFQKHLAVLNRRKVVSIRDVSRLLSHVALISAATNFNEARWGWKEATAVMLLMKVLAPELYQDVLSGRGSFDRISEFYGELQITDRSDEAHNHDVAIIRGVAQVIAGDEVDSDDKEHFYKGFEQFGRKPDGAKVRRSVAEDYLDWPEFPR
jgi:hypothetical protein